MNKITKSILSSLSDEIENGLNVNFECRYGEVAVVWYWDEDEEEEEEDQEQEEDTPLIDSDNNPCENHNSQDTDYETLESINSSLLSPQTIDNTLDDADENDYLFPSWKCLTDEEKKDILDREMDEYWANNSNTSINKKIKYMMTNAEKGNIRDILLFFTIVFNMLNNNKHASHLLNSDRFKAVCRGKIKEIIYAGKMTKDLYEEVCQLYPKLVVPKEDVVLGRPYWNLFTTEQQKRLTDE